MNMQIIIHKKKKLRNFLLVIPQLPVADPFLEKVNLSDLGEFCKDIFFYWEWTWNWEMRKYERNNISLASSSINFYKFRWKCKFSSSLVVFTHHHHHHHPNKVCLVLPWKLNWWKVFRRRYCFFSSRENFKFVWKINNREKLHQSWKISRKSAISNVKFNENLINRRDTKK